MQRIGELHSHNLEPGCYVDGHWGWRAVAQFVETFDGVLYTLDDDERQIVADYLADGSGERYVEDNIDLMMDLCYECECVANQALASHLQADWHDGEFFISPYDPEEDDDQ